MQKKLTGGSSSHFSSSFAAKFGGGASVLVYRVEKVEKGTGEHREILHSKVLGEHKHDHNFPPWGQTLHLLRPVFISNAIQLYNPSV